MSAQYFHCSFHGDACGDTSVRPGHKGGLQVVTLGYLVYQLFIMMKPSILYSVPTGQNISGQITAILAPREKIKAIMSALKRKIYAKWGPGPCAERLNIKNSEH